MVEPQPEIFRRLEKNTIGLTRVELVNAAVDEKSGWRELFCVKSDRADLPSWIDQVASFHRQHLVRHGIPETLIEGVKVRTVSFDGLLTECNLKKLDLLQIDTEGMDGRLLSIFPFGRLKPSVIYYEIVHMSDTERWQVKSLLCSFGYAVIQGDSKQDEMAIRL
jgi:FkbM family methyltransferase